MSQIVERTETVVLNPTGNTGTSGLSTTTNYPASNGYTNTSSTTYARFTPSSTSSNGYTYYTFTVPNIPTGATITGVTCVAKIRVSNTSYVTNTGIQLYTGTTAKGSSAAFSSTSSSNTVTINGGSNWTLSEISNIRLRFQGRKGSSNNNGYIYFYGANLTIQYTYNETVYDITSILSTDLVDSIDPGGLVNVSSGENYNLKIYTDSSLGDDIIVEDNGIDVTNQVTLEVDPGESITNTYDASFYDSDASVYYDTYNNTSDQAVDGVYSNNVPSNGATGVTSTTRACVFSVDQANASSNLTYGFDLSNIPQDAIINSVSCSAKASYYQSGSLISTHVLQLYSGNTAKGSSVSVTGSGSTSSTHTVNGGSSWTREELNNLRIKYTVTRGSNTGAASFSFWGATLSVSYSIPGGEYYNYSLNNVDDDHFIEIKNAIIEIPDEDPTKNYYSISVSSINAETTPGRGTIRLEEGSNQVIEIHPTDPLITLITDNGVDVSSQLVLHGGGSPSYTVATASGASYGFTQNGNGYYQSTNNGVSKSASVARVTFSLPVRCLVTIKYINYAEANYDYGLFGKVDTTVATDGLTASSGQSTPSDNENNYYLICRSSQYNTSSVQTLTYEIEAGTHYIDIKYGKDDATDSNNDTLQWKIDSIQELEPNNYYTYTLSNIQQDHSLVFIFGDVTYYFINSSGTGSKLFPNGSIVYLPGDNYSLTIVPDDYSYEVSLIDNNIDKTTYVERKEEQKTKDGVTITVVNYIYKLTDIQTTHNIVVNCFPPTTLYVKKNGQFERVPSIYKKVNNEWVEQTDLTTIFESNKIYINK